MRTRCKYDSLLVGHYVQKKEQLKPGAFRSQMPYSTFATWQDIDYSSYDGHTLRHQLDESISLAVTLDENKKWVNFF